MRVSIKSKLATALTLIELLVIIAILAMLFVALIVGGTLANGGLKSKPLSCMSNLRQFQIGVISWSSDNGGQLPWQVSTNLGGSIEIASNGSAADHFLVLTGYLKNPVVFHCPGDLRRIVTTNYSTFNNSNLSYFMNLDAITNNQFSFTAGDRHLQVSSQPAKPGLLTVTNGSAMGWTKELHPPLGSLVFADGHFEFVKSEDLADKFVRQSLAVDRLVIP